MTKWQYHLLAISIFYLVSLPTFINSQKCPAFDENGECKLKCQCTQEPGKCLRDEQFCDGVSDCQDGQVRVHQMFSQIPFYICNCFVREKKLCLFDTYVLFIGYTETKNIKLKTKLQIFCC